MLIARRTSKTLTAMISSCSATISTKAHDMEQPADSAKW